MQAAQRLKEEEVVAERLAFLQRMHSEQREFQVKKRQQQQRRRQHEEEEEEDD